MLYLRKSEPSSPKTFIQFALPYHYLHRWLRTSGTSTSNSSTTKKVPLPSLTHSDIFTSTELTLLHRSWTWRRRRRYCCWVSFNSNLVLFLLKLSISIIFHTKRMLFPLFLLPFKTLTCRDALDKLELKRYCCRRMVLTHVDLIVKLLSYNISKPFSLWIFSLTFLFKWSLSDNV